MPENSDKSETQIQVSSGEEGTGCICDDIFHYNVCEIQTLYRPRITDFLWVMVKNIQLDLQYAFKIMSCAKWPLSFVSPSLEKTHNNIQKHYAIFPSVTAEDHEALNLTMQIYSKCFLINAANDDPH